jgi:hypothetical protein
MKLFLLSLVFLSSTYAGWNTASSFSFGAKYFDELETADIKVEQFFIHSAVPDIYYKIGFYNEQLAHWEIDGTTSTTADQGHNLSIGTGYNLFTLGNVFMDIGLSLNYRTGVSDRTTDVTISGSPVTIVSEYNDEPIAVAAEIGIGFATGSFTVRLDVFAAPNGSVNLLNAQNQALIQSNVSYSRLHANLGLAYWY